MKVLVVDDEIVSQKKMLKIMEEFGECVSVASGQEAIDTFRQAWETGLPFELIFLDISMPDISGIDVLNKIRAIEKKKALTGANIVKVIMVTAHSHQDVVVGSMKAGCNNYIVKPFDRSKVVQKMKSIGLPVD